MMGDELRRYFPNQNGMTPVWLECGRLPGGLVYELSRSSELNSRKEWDMWGVTVYKILSRDESASTGLSKSFDSAAEARAYIVELQGGV